MQIYTYDDIQIGQSASVTKTISEYDVYAYAGIIGDFNPVHINAPYAEGTFFKERIAHGMLTASFVSTVLGMYLPGPGAIFISNTANFLAPVRIGDTITTICTVAEKLEKGRVRLESVITNQHGETVMTGESLVSVPKSKK
ncbi:MAG: MaoC family dehydratase [Defluviitaleaceae bacterium]|nr:MaoC family dehydratase [Defluviitaleaceae bacterium]